MENYKRVLIISNNALSLTKNNGKTLESFFVNFPAECLAQLYFSDEIPESSCCNNFFSISERDIINKIFVKRRNKKNNSENKSSNIVLNRDKYSQSEFFRVIRELLWRKSFWKSDKLYCWVKQFAPEIIFFCGGDSGFAYTITESIQKNTEAKLVLYLTDDYILGKANCNLFYKIRKLYIFSKMRKCIKKANLFFTISDKMSKTYEEIFKKESRSILNLSNYGESKLKTDFGEEVVFTYMGGFSYGRDKVLIELGNALREYNESNSMLKTSLEIYSTDMSSTEIINEFMKNKTIKFGGKLNSIGVKKKLKDTDILVHVESFDHYNREKTRYSISTKIPEYLSSKRLIVAIGPDDIASMEYLKDVAICINRQQDIYVTICNVLKNKSLRETSIQRSYELYCKKHDPKVVRKEFERLLYEL